MPSVTKEEALTALKVVKCDLESLESGDWIPDADSIWAVIAQLGQVQAFLEGLSRFLISGHVQAPGSDLEPEPIKLVVVATSLERACTVARGIYPNLQLEQARIATIFEDSCPDCYGF